MAALVLDPDFRLCLLATRNDRLLVLEPPGCLDVQEPGREGLGELSRLPFAVHICDRVVHLVVTEWVSSSSRFRFLFRLSSLLFSPPEFAASLAFSQSAQMLHESSSWCFSSL